MDDERLALGWNDRFQRAFDEWRTAAGAAMGSGPEVLPTRVMRVDRGWSTLQPSGPTGGVRRIRNIGADVAVGDWVVPAAGDERVEHVLERTSALVRRASFAGAKGERHTLAANVDVVCLLHALTSPPNPRRLERELVLAFDSGARPVVLLTKVDAVDDPASELDAVARIALDVPVLAVSSRRGDGVEYVRGLVEGHLTIALLGSSGVGKSTLVNRLVGSERQRTGEVREGDDRGRHTTSAAELVAVPGGGWLVDTPGLRAVTLWSSGRGIERAFADVFAVMDQCRFRNCKHDEEPGCAVQAAIAAGTLRADRLDSLKRLVAEEATLEDEQRERERATDRRGHRRRPSP